MNSPPPKTSTRVLYLIAPQLAQCSRAGQRDSHQLQLVLHHLVGRARALGARRHLPALRRLLHRQ